MSGKIIHVLCEGQTEEGFVNEVLKPYLRSMGVIAVKSIKVTTNKKKNARGGLISYSHVADDLWIMRQAKDNAYERHVFTTMFDLYALPDDFPGYDMARKISNAYERVKALETSFSRAVNDYRFVPYVQLHEFEALVFCGLDYLKDIYPGCDAACNALKEILAVAKGNPELIDNGPDTAPSKRLINAIEENTKSGYRYNKPMTGKDIASKVGMEELRHRCSHFNEWITALIEA